MWVNLSPKKDKMKKTGKGLARVLTIAALGVCSDRSSFGACGRGG